MMSCVFAAMIAAAIICGAANGSIAAVLDALTEGAANAVTLSLSLAGAYMLWMGLMGIARRAGLIDALSRAMRKPLGLLFPNAGEAIAPITLNLAANFFGAGSAATPFGLEAMKELNAKAKYAGVATDEMCMFLALNASALELLPANVLALRTAAGSDKEESSLTENMLVVAFRQKLSQASARRWLWPGRFAFCRKISLRLCFTEAEAPLLVDADGETRFPAIYMYCRKKSPCRLDVANLENMAAC